MENQLDLQSKCNRLEEILSTETDRGAAILGAAYIDERLKEIIQNYLRDCKATTNLLSRQISTLDSRISMAFALGIINLNEHEGLNGIRDIRNAFAHDFLESLTFDDPKIASRCGNLFYVDHFWISKKKVRTSRDKFICSVFILGRSLLFRISKEDRLEPLYD